MLRCRRDFEKFRFIIVSFVTYKLAMAIKINDKENFRFQPMYSRLTV